VVSDVASDVVKDVYDDVDFEQLATHLCTVRFLQEFQRWTASQTVSTGPTAPLQRVFYHLTHWCAYYANNAADDILKLAKFAHSTLYKLMTQADLDVGTASDTSTVQLLAAWEADVAACSKSARSRLNEVCMPTYFKSSRILVQIRVCSSTAVSRADSITYLVQGIAVCTRSSYW
jgi:hypothetical protein